MNLEFYTIGVYGLSSEQFFEKVLTNKIDTFIDIRRRRAVRGSKYSFVNSIRLQEKLKSFDLNYIHILELAPTNEIRLLQKVSDKNNGIIKSDRKVLVSTFKEKYTHDILDMFDLNQLIKRLLELKSNKVVLFCVEAEAQACHRSIVAEKIEKEYSIHITHL